MKHKPRILTVITAALVMLSGAGLTGRSSSVETLPRAIDAEAASVDYPMQLMNIASKDNSSVLAENGTSDGSSLSVKPLGNDLSPSWRFDRVGTDSKGTFFKLCNAQSGRLLTPDGYNVTSGSPVIMFGSESHQTQHWYVIPVKNDRLGNGLYYKIVNYANTDLALTSGSSGMTLETYTEADNQLWLLNCDGLQGFAGYCQNDNTNNIKASSIGGLFGEVVEASSFDELKKYAESDTPYTIVVKNNFSVTNLQMDSQNHYYCPDGRIYVRSNKTIIGSYGAHTLNNVQFCTSSGKGVGNNVIIKNLDLKHDEKSNGNDSIVVYFGSGQNLWVDHVTFSGHYAVNTQGENTPDWDKLFACCYDADYCTVSDSSFGLHEYGLILGYPDDKETSYQKYNDFPRMSIIGNKFENTVTRGPGLMRYGYFHSLNNYVNKFSMAYTVFTASKVFAENCIYENGGNVICDWDSTSHPGSYAETGSKFSGCKRTTIEGYAQNCTWRPQSNYSYVTLSADQAKNYCSSFSAAQSSSSDMMYLRYGQKGVPSAGLNTPPDTQMPTEPPTEPPTNPQAVVVNAENGDSLNADWLTTGEIGSELKVNDTYSITASGEKLVNVIERETLTSDGNHSTSNVIALGGGGSGDYRSIKVNAKGAGTLTVYMSSSNADTPRTVLLLDDSGNTAASIENVVGSQTNAYTFDIPSQGTYYVASSSSGLNVCYAEVVYALVKLRGDANADGSVNAADLVTVQKYVLGSGELPDWEAADLCEDGVINCFDIVLLRKLLNV